MGSAFNQGSEGTGKTWWKVKVIKGPNTGKEGWVQAGSLGSILTVKNAGKLESTTEVGDGSVEVHTGQELEREGAPDGDNNFALTYKGKDADDAKWLQFIWREIVGVDDKGASTPVAGSITTTGGTYDLTANGTYDNFGKPGKSNYNTDCPDPSNPFYETVGEADRTADSTKMIDMPGAAVGQVKGAFKNGAKKVASRAHFSTFLIKGRKVTFQTAIDIAWNFQKKEDADAPPKGRAHRLGLVGGLVTPHDDRGTVPRAVSGVQGHQVASPRHVALGPARRAGRANRVGARLRRGAGFAHREEQLHGDHWHARARWPTPGRRGARAGHR